MDPNTIAYYNSGIRLGMPVRKLESIDGFSLDIGGQHYYFAGSTTPCNLSISAIMAANKSATHRLLGGEGVPVPKFATIMKDELSLEHLIEITKPLTYPLVVKPAYWAGLGIDVHCNVLNVQSLYEHCKRLFEGHFDLLIEEYHTGLRAFRVLMFQGKVVSVIERFPAQIVGDGRSSIEHLVEMTNQKRATQSGFYAPIEWDVDAIQCLQLAKKVKTDVLMEGETLQLGYACNASRGGTILCQSKKMCAENKALFRQVTKLMNLEWCGIDVLCQSMSMPVATGNGIILEINHNPSIRIHEEGVGGRKEMVTMEVMKSFKRKHRLSYWWHRLFGA